MVLLYFQLKAQEFYYVNKHNSDYIDFSNFSEKLICINEAHGLKSNYSAYLDILKQVKSTKQHKDSIIVFLEQAFSASILYNDYPKSEFARTFIKTNSNPDLIAFLDSIYLLNVPIRFFSADFEYDPKLKRNHSLLYVLQKLKNRFSLENMETENISDLETKVKALKNINTEKARLQKHLNSIRNSVSSDMAIEVDQMLFILNGKFNFSSVRDQAIYDRTLNAIEKGQINFKNKLVLLIHGTAHINPANKKSLYNLFSNDSRSPFKDNSNIIGNIYLDCKGSSGAFGGTYFFSGSFYTDKKYDSALFDFLQQKKLEEKKISILEPSVYKNLLFPFIDHHRILALYIHNRIH